MIRFKTFFLSAMALTFSASFAFAQDLTIQSDGPIVIDHDINIDGNLTIISGSNIHLGNPGANIPQPNFNPGPVIFMDATQNQPLITGQNISISQGSIQLPSAPAEISVKAADEISAAQNEIAKAHITASASQQASMALITIDAAVLRPSVAFEATQAIQNANGIIEIR